MTVIPATSLVILLLGVFFSVAGMMSLKLGRQWLDGMNVTQVSRKST